MRAFASFFLSLLLVAIVAPAHATHDGGESAVLRALVGEPARYAVFQRDNINFQSLACESFYAVDLRGQAWSQRSLKDAEPAPNPDAEPAEEQDISDPTVLRNAIQSCLKSIGPDVAALPITVLEAETFDTFFQWSEDTGCESDCDEPGDENEDIDPRPKSVRHLKALLEVVATGKSRIYTDHCGEPVDEDGKPVPDTERCEVVFRGQSATWQFSIRDTRTGTSFIGTSQVVEPDELSQVLMGLEYDGKVEDIGVPSIELMHLQVHETADHIFIFGSVAHEPTANGTYFPVAAIVPKQAQNGRLPFASPRGCACEAGAATPFGTLGGAVLILLFLAVRARRSDSSHAARSKA